MPGNAHFHCNSNALVSDSPFPENTICNYNTRAITMNSASVRFRMNYFWNPGYFIIPVLLLVCQCFPVQAQQKDSRPRVGLALSGGGSLGMAHVGVLKVMEEAGLRPDLITGVSMGSIVGGMYAIGYSPDSLHKILKNTDWSYILTNNLPENKISFTEKHNFKNSIMSLPVSSGKKISLPSGLINGQQIENMLSYYAWPSAAINDFMKLPIPFKCLGTDIITTSIVELKSGYLPEAMRASMAVPSIFTPVRIDKSLLIDGGVLRNIAVSELQEMGAGIIIGSYTGFHPYKEEDLHSAAGILKQIGFLQSVIDYNEEKKKLDIVIEPDLKDYSSTVFTNVDSIIQRGYRAALPFKPAFKKLADSLNRLGVQKAPEFILDRQYYSFDKVRVEGNKIYSDEQILGVLDIKSGDLVNKQFITEKIELLYGKAWFDKVNYRIEPVNNSLHLVINCIEREKVIIYGSVYYDNAIRSGIILAASLKNLIIPRSSIDIDAFIGQYYRFRLNAIQFVDRNQKLGLSMSMNAANTIIPAMTFREETGQFSNRTYNLDIGLSRMIGLNAMSSLSASLESFNLVPGYISAANLKRVSLNSYSINYQYQANTVDKKYYPNRGTISNIAINTAKPISARVKTSQSDRRYDRNFSDDFGFRRTYTLTGNIRHFFNAGKKTTLSVKGSLLYTYHVDSALSHNNYYYIGGIGSTTGRSIPMTGFHANEIPAERFASLGFDADIELLRDLHLELMTDAGLAREVKTNTELSYMGGLGLGLGYMSIIGPVRAGFMYGLSSRVRYFSSFKGFIAIGFNF